MELFDIYHNGIPGFLDEAAELAPLRRLRQVGMNCGCEYTAYPLFSGIAPYSRFDHSLGVALIVWHFTGDVAQSLSGLLHDISTPVFAHVVDFLHGDHMAQESTEAATADMIRSSPELCKLLEAHSLSPADVEDYHRYPIADNDSPKLSADRLEYTLGNSVNFGILTREQASCCYRDLAVGINENGEPELVFRTPEQALTFASASLACSRIYVSDPDRYAMQFLAELLKDAIIGGILSEEDLYLQEPDVIGRLLSSSLGCRWERFRRFHTILRQDTPGEDGSWRRIFAKKRYIDPYVRDLGRVSALFPAYEEQLNAFRTASHDYWLSAR